MPAVRKLYRTVDVWVRIEAGRLARYRCFDVLQDDVYCVQSKDFFEPALSREQEERSERQFIELLAEEAPESREGAHPSLEAAIAANDADFDDEV